MSDSDSDNDVYSNYWKKKKLEQKASQPSKPSLDSTASNFNIHQSKLYSDNLIKQRGFEIDSSDLPNIALSSNSNSKPTMSIISGQKELSLPQLEKELSSSLQKKNLTTSSSLLHTILSRFPPSASPSSSQSSSFLSSSQFLSYSLLHIDILFSLHLPKEVIQVAQNALLFQNLLPLSSLSLLYYHLSKSKLALPSLLLSGFYDLLKCKAFFSIPSSSFSPSPSFSSISSPPSSLPPPSSLTPADGWSETEKEKQARLIEELSLQYEIRLKQEKRDNMLGLAGSSRVGVLGKNDNAEREAKLIYFSELRGRKILNLYVDDHCILTLIRNCTCEICETLGWAECSETNIENKENLVFAWGENALGQVDFGNETLFFEKPTLVRELIGKKIEGLGGWRGSYVAYDEEGNIYEWGGGQIFRKLFETKKKITRISKGSSFTTFTTSSNELYFFGSLPKSFFSSSTPILLPTPSPLNYIFGSLKTFFGITTEGKVLYFGENPEKEEEIIDNKNSEGKLKIFDKLSTLEVKKLKQFENGIYVLTKQNEVFLNKKEKALIPIELPCDLKITDFDFDGHSLFCLDEEGVVWKGEEGGGRMKGFEACKNELFYNVNVGKNFQVFSKKLLSHEKTFVSFGKEERLETHQILEVNVHLFNEASLIFKKLSLQCRYYLILLDSPEPDTENLRKLCIELTSSKKKENNNNNVILFEEILNNSMMKLSVKDEGEGIHKINFFLQKSGSYYLYVFLNEKFLNGCPLELHLEKSILEEKKENEAQSAIQKEEIEKRNAEEKKKLMELKLKMEKEAKETKIKQTENRAEEALKKQIQQKTQAHLNEQEEKKMRADLIVGGGFNLNKVQNLKSATSSQASGFNSSKAQNFKNSNNGQIPQKRASKK